MLKINFSIFCRKKIVNKLEKNVWAFFKKYEN